MTDTQLEQAAGWQPIKTAPDGPCLVCYKHKGKWVFRIAERDDLSRWLTLPAHWHIQPIHWMPLPEPPK